MKRLIWLAVLLLSIPAMANGQGAVSIETVNTLLPNYSIQGAQPARFVFRINNTTGSRCDISTGFKISSPDGAVWDSVTIDSAGPTVDSENRFISYFDVVYAMWGGVTMGGDGTNPDTVGIIGAGNRSRATRLLPMDYNDTGLAVIVWMHEDLASFGKHICVDSSFWGVGGSWKWVSYALIDYSPTFAGLPGLAYSDGSGPDRIGSGYCFAVSDRIVPDTGNVVYVPDDYSTIQAAVNAVDNGDTILVRPGTYHESIVITGKALNLKSTDGPLTTIITNAADSHLVVFQGSATNGSLLEGFTLQGGYLGIWCQESAPIIRRNLLRNQHAYNWGAIALSGMGWGTEGVALAQIINNTIYGNTGGGISTFSTVAPTIKNNIIAFNVKYGIHVQDETSPPIDPSYNDVFGSASLYYNVPDPGPGSLSADPKFAANFTLLPESPCINTGDPASAYNDPDGSRNDMGAFPFDGTVEPPISDTLFVPVQYNSIQVAIDAAVDGNVILVGPGGYLGGINFNGKLVKVVSSDGPFRTRILPLLTPDTVIMYDLVTFNHGENSQAVLEGFRLESGRIGVLCVGSGPTIRGNVFHSQSITSWAAICLTGSYVNEVATIGPAPAIIENNTIMNCANGGISTFSSVAPVIRNNIIYGNHAYGIHKQNSSLPLVMAYNDIFGNPDGNYNIGDYGPGALFVDPRIDYNGVLSSNSPCIDAGDPDPKYNDPDGTRNDMGAIPYTGDIPAGTDTIYVPTDFSTIQTAIDAAPRNGTVLVYPGIYSGPVVISDKVVNLKSIDGPLATTITTPGGVPIITLRGSATNGSTVEGFTLLGGYIGVWCQNSAPIIRHNLLRDQDASNWAAIVLSGFDYGTTGSSAAMIVNNTITGCTGGGISNFSTVAPTITNNVVAFNSKYGMHAWLPSPLAVTSYNNVIGGSRFLYFQVEPGPGSFSLDPLFASDYTLASGSPCINAGDPDSVYNDPDGSRNDMGAVPSGGGVPIGLMNLVQWKAADGGNDHWYAVIPQKLYWVQADILAKAFTVDGHSGHLAAITSSTENQFITDHVLVGANQGNRFDNFFIGGREESGAWKWITNERFGFTNWASGEPNNNGIETALCMYGHYDTYSNATPGTWNNSLPDSSVNTLHRYWSVVEFGTPDTILVEEPIPTNEWISLYCDHPRLDGFNLEPGTVIRVFDPQGVLCGKATVKANGSFGFLLVYRDDPYTAADEGAVQGDELQFSIDGEPVEAGSEVYWTANGDQFATCSFARKTCITLHLEQGWNLVSWNVGWSGTPQELLAPIVNCVDLVLAFDQGGLIYDPQLERFSTLSSMDNFHGYWIKMNCAADLEVCGSRIRSIPAIPVNRGWNLVSYLPSFNLEPYTAFYTIADYLQVAIGYDHGAKIYIPTNPTFNTLTTLTPGAGYWLRMSAAGTLVYGLIPADNDESRQPLAQANDQSEPFGSRVWMSLYGDEITLDGQPLASNSTIEVFTAEDVIVGSAVYANGLLKFMPVYGKDGDDASARLATANAKLTLKVNGQSVTETITWTGEGTSYRIGALTTSGLPTTYSLEQNYPNPFNPATTIAFSVPNRQQVKLVVYNLLGQQVRTLTNETYDAGRYEVIWDGRDASGDQVPTGLYFYRFETRDIHLTNKMLLLK